MKQQIILNKNENFDVGKLETSLGECSYASICYPHHEVNQDSLAIFQLENDDLVMLVSDGMGGHAAGEVASKIICETFKKTLSKKSTNLRNKVLDAIEKSNKEVRKLKVGAGATLTCCYIKKKGVIRFFNIGDSSQLLLGSRGKIKFRGVEHSPLGHGIEAGIIEDRVEQELVEDNIISNGVGFQKMRVEMSVGLEILEGDIVFLASDGVTGIMNEEKYVNLVTSGDFNDRVARIVQSFKEDESTIQDDSTVILYRHGK